MARHDDDAALTQLLTLVATLIEDETGEQATAGAWTTSWGVRSSVIRTASWTYTLTPKSLIRTTHAGKDKQEYDMDAIKHPRHPELQVKH